MEALFTRDYMLLWTFVLALALFVPVRQLMWVLYVRRASREQKPDEAEKTRLRRRAGVTAGLLSFVFAIAYTTYLFRDTP